MNQKSSIKRRKNGGKWHLSLIALSKVKRRQRRSIHPNWAPFTKKSPQALGKKQEKASAGETSASKEQKFTKCEISWIFIAPGSRYCRFYLIELLTNGQKRTCSLAGNANAQKFDSRSLILAHNSYELLFFRN